MAAARVLKLGRNCGFAAAVNRGIEASDADWVAILNNDVTLDLQWLEVLLGAMGESAFAAGKTLSAADPSIIDGTFDEISRAACAWRCGSGRRDGPVWNQPRRIRIAPMTAALFRRNLFDEVGFLDEQFVSYLEDIEFGIRCGLAGEEGIYVPAAVACHRGSATLGRWNKDTVRWIARNQMLLTAKHFGGQPSWPIVAGQLLWGLVAFRHGRGFSWLRGRMEGRRAVRLLKRDRGPEAQATQKFAEFLEASERVTFDLQKQTGFDPYWRAYFWLLRR